jgi:hypothetical protein
LWRERSTNNGDQPSAEGTRLAYDFRKKLDDLPAVVAFGPDVDQVMKTDDRGLRITLPQDRPDQNNVGIELPLKLRGDFDVNVGYEILGIGTKLTNPGAGLHLRLQLDDSTPVVALTRLVSRFRGQPAPLYSPVGHDGEIFAAFRIGTLPNGNENGFSEGVRARAIAPDGRLRLVRKGGVLTYFVTDGVAPPHVLKTEKVGDAGVSSLRLFAFSGWGPVGVDVRFTDLAVAADEFPDGVPGRLDWSKATLPAQLLAGFLIAAGLGSWLWARRRHRDQSPAHQGAPA